jgi:DNA-binding MarR family transcriptional regulator
MNGESIDIEYIILENIYDSSRRQPRQSPLRQRDLAQIAGTSLGMTNSILKRLAQKGWITIKKMNSRNIQYAVTLAGINEIIHRSLGYFKRTIKNVVYYREYLDEIILQAKRKNVTTVLLVGVSDLDFIVEHTCQHYGLSFLKAVDRDTALQAMDDRTFAVFSENIPEPGGPDANVTETMASWAGRAGRKNSLYLSRVVIKKAAQDTTEGVL